MASLAPAFAQQAVIYRCIDANGALTIQNGKPCPKGVQQERRVITAPMVMPAQPVPRSPAPAPAAAVPPEPYPNAAAAAARAPAADDRPEAVPPTPIADADRLPPPPIYQCNTWDNDSYIREDPNPEPRCVPLDINGFDGNPALAAGAACEMKTDQCQRVPDGAACDAWKKRQREIEATWRYAKTDAKAPLQEEFARVSRILGETTCGKP